MIKTALFTLSLFFATSAAAAFEVVEQDVQDLKAVFATVESTDVVKARARIGGTLERLDVDEGSLVRQGDVIALVVDPKISLELAALDARSQSLKAEEHLARIALDRARSLRKSGAGSQARLDEAETALDVVRRNLAAMEAERSVVAQRADEGRVLAPSSGRVISVFATKNSVVLTGEIIADIAQENFILRMYLPERHARFLVQGTKVFVGERGLSTDRNDLKDGLVRQVYPRLDRGRVVADIDVDGIGNFHVGERVRVFVPTGARKAIVVPSDYLIKRHGLTFVRHESGVETVVQTGLSLEGGIEILSGLRPGDKLSVPTETR